MEIERSLFWQLSLARKHLLNSLEKDLDPTGLNVPQFVILRITAREGVTSPGTLADRLRLERPAVSRFLRSLKEQGYLRSRRSKIDARHDELRLTAAGERKLAEVEQHYAAFDHRLAEHFTPAELDTLLDLIGRLANRL